MYVTLLLRNNDALGLAHGFGRNFFAKRNIITGRSLTAEDMGPLYLVQYNLLLTTAGFDVMKNFPPAAPRVRTRAGSSVSFNHISTKGKFEMVDLLGEGSYGKVLEISVDNHCDGVMKLMLLREEAMAFREVEILSAVNHNNIISLTGAYFDKTYFMLHFKTLCPTKLQDVPRKHQRELLLQIVDAVSYLHQNSIMHRDIKPDNIMVDEEWCPKLLDFGMAKVTSGRAWTTCGTLLYAAPEILLQEGYTNAVDIYSLGKTADELYLFLGTAAFEDLFVPLHRRPDLEGLRHLINSQVVFHGVYEHTTHVDDSSTVTEESLTESPDVGAFCRGVFWLALFMLISLLIRFYIARVTALNT